MPFDESVSFLHSCEENRKCIVEIWKKKSESFFKPLFISCDVKEGLVPVEAAGNQLINNR